MVPIHVMVNGMPGNMAVLVARHILADSRFNLIPYSLTGPEIPDSTWLVGSSVIALIRPKDRESMTERIRETKSEIIMIDYTHPTATHDNAAYYCRHGFPFVMGTTGGNRDLLTEAVRNSNISAIIAPNMGKQIVGFQAMMAYAAEQFPGLFSGYSLKIRESHQSSKADTSGTAKAMIGYFNRMGVPCRESDIEMIRDPEIQKHSLKVPDAFLGGHGWHTYTLTSPDKTVCFEFTHNVNGREIYVGGTLDAVVFLSKKTAEGSKGCAFDMMDVLSASSPAM